MRFILVALLLLLVFVSKFFVINGLFNLNIVPGRLDESLDVVVVLASTRGPESKRTILWLKLVVFVKVEFLLFNRLDIFVLKLDDLVVEGVVPECCCCCSWTLFMSSRTFFLKFCGEMGDDVPDEVRDDGEDVDEVSEDAESEEHEC